MLIRAGRTVLSAAFVLLSSAVVVQAQQPVRTVATTRTITPVTHAQHIVTPFDRYMRPLLDKLAAKSQSQVKSPALVKSQLTPAASSAVSPNFGGYIGPVAYPARAATSAQYDTENNGVNSVLAADFDKDGQTDLLVLQNDGSLNILHNNGGGALSAPIGYLNTGANVDGISLAQSFIADLNGDGYPDVVAYDQNNLQVLAWVNNGDGTFGQPTLTPLSTTLGSVAGIAVADVDGDGKPDVVAAYYNFVSQTSGTVTVQTLKGNGSASFTALNSTNFNIPTYVQLPGYSPIALGDLNGDGRLDIALLNLQRTGFFSADFDVYTAPGNGDGTFGALNTTPVLTGSTNNLNTSGVHLLDLNNDGKLDVATDLNSMLYTALGTGSGTFGAQLSSVFDNGSSTIFADMNGDGFPDAIAGDGTVVGVYTSNGDGTFTASAADTQYVTSLSSGNAVAIADFNGDGKLDLAGLSDSYFQVQVYTGNGDGSLGGPRALILPGDPLPYDNQLLGVLNANNDSDSDIFLANYLGDNLTLYTGLGDGKGNFNYVPALATSALPSDYAELEPFQADLNGDGRQDIVMIGYAGELWTSLAKGDGTFLTPVAANMPTLACPLSNGSAGDVNGDGKADLVIAYPGDAACGGSNYAAGYFVLKGNGDGTFQTPAFFPAGVELYSATLADMNNDGVPDLLLNDLPSDGTDPYQITMQLGNGDGTFGAASTVLSGYLVSDFKVGDINQDGKPDLVLSEEEMQNGSIATGGIMLILGNADGTFGAHTQLAIGQYFGGISLADINGDGIPDIEASQASYYGQANTYFGFVTLLGTGQGGFSAPTNQLVAASGSLVLTGNFLNDNAPDVILQASEGIGLFIAQGGTTLSLATGSPTLDQGATETLTATLAATVAGRPTPTGTVSFYDGTTLLGTAEASAGTASYVAPNLAVGTHSFTATYSGDSNFNLNTASTSATVTVSTLAPAFTLTGTPTALTLTQGANGTVVLSLAANATFSGAVTLTCSGAPTNGTCGFDTSTVNLTPGGTATATLVVGTTGTVTTTASAASPWAHGAGMVSMAGLAVFFWSRRRRLRYMSAFGAALLAFAALGISGCGGSDSKTTTPTTPTAPVVTAGSYNLTVTATPSGSSATAQTATVSLTVQ